MASVTEASFAPYWHSRLMGVTAIPTEPNRGTPDDPRIHPSWHRLVYAGGKRGTGKESLVSPEAKVAWPVEFLADRTMKAPPPESKFAGSSSTVAELKANPPKRQRRTGATLRGQARSLRSRGMVIAAIGNHLNISDRRVKELLREPE
jgi:hypothetical protein